MSLHWYACISTNICRFETHHISLETDWWALPNASSIVWIRSAVHEILADEAFTATDGLISQSFIVAFVHPAYVRIALIWGFPAQLSLWNSVHWLWRYKLNEVCDTTSNSEILIPVFSNVQYVQQPWYHSVEKLCNGKDYKDQKYRSYHKIKVKISTSDYSEKCKDFGDNCWSSLTTLAIGFSWWL